MIQKPAAPAHIPAQDTANAANVWHITAGAEKFPDAFSVKKVKEHMTDLSKIFTGTTKKQLGAEPEHKSSMALHEHKSFISLCQRLRMTLNSTGASRQK